MLTEGLVTVSYLAATILFILSLGGLSNPETARRGNFYGFLGMSIAILATVTGPHVTQPGYLPLTIAIVIGSGIGIFAAKKVKMTEMPELVALMHSLVGLAAVLVGYATYLDTTQTLTGAEKTIHEVEIYLGILIGAVTFSGSVIAFGKLSGKITGKPLTLPGRHFLNLGLLIAAIFVGHWFLGLEVHGELLPLYVMTGLSLLFGIHMVMAIGGADMPVVVSMLNSYSGWAAAGIGFTLNNPVLIIAGACVGSSGAILSYIMCKAMNRSILAVLLGGFGAEAAAGGGDDGGPKNYKTGSPEDAAFLMENADTVIIVPGYGLAVARAQHALKELTEKLTHHGVTVKYAIHPVAGRMPGHMNVLLAEAEVPYDQVFEMEDINSDFGQADVVLVLGANDVVNPAARTPGSPIFGMPILEAFKAKTIIVNKRSMAAGYAGLDNELFYMDKTMMVFGDAKKVVEDMVKAVE